MPIINRLLSPHYQQCRLASTSTIQGWTTSVTKTGKHVFMKIDEGNGKEPVQVIADKELIKEQKVNVGSAITATGTIQKSLGSQQETEFVAEQLKVVGWDSNPRYDLGTDQLRKNLFLRARNSKFAAFLRARSAIFRETHEFFMNKDFIHIDTPKLTENDCEGGGEVFDVVSEPEEYRMSGADYQKMHLTVSSQLHLEAMVSRLGKVYTLGPAFRAEKQLSHTHLSEFHMLEAEVAFLETTSDLCDLVESYLTHMTQFVHSSPVLQSSLKTMETQPKINTSSDPFPRITFEEAVEILKSAGESVTSKGGLSRKNELFLVKSHGDRPVFVTDFPVKHKPFYMARDGDNTLSFDLLVPGIGELAGGSVREHNLRDLEQRCQIDWYLELRRRGQPPTGGFGIGFERLLQYLLGVHHIRDTIAFPRWYRQVKC